VSEASASLAPSLEPGKVDACGILATADLTKVLGMATVLAKPMPGGGWVAGQCAWNGPTSGFFLSVGNDVSIDAAGDPGARDAKAKLAQFVSRSTDSKRVPGIGDGAAVTQNGIAAYKDGTYLEVTNLGLTEAQLIEVAKLVTAGL
jgi:hypothetical protein